MPSHLVRSKCWAICVFFLLSGLAFGQADAALFDPLAMQEIRLTVDAIEWQTLRDRYELNDYYHADFSWKGTTLANVGIRSRGSGSRSAEKPNLTVKFNKFVKGQKLLKHETIILKANNQDASMMRDFLAMGLYRKMGIPAPRESYARLFVNGEFFGLYVVVEDLDESFLDRVYGESKGYLVEFNPQPGYQFDYRGDDPIAYALGDMWEAKTHEDEPELQTLFDMLRTVNEAPDATWFEESGAYVDLKAFMALLAAENYIADADGILSDPWGMNNFYLYRKATDTQFRFLPWDADFGMSWDGREVLHNIPLNVLTRRAYEVPDLRKTYIETMLQAAVVAGGADGWLADEIERVYALIAEDARLDPNKRCLASGRQASCNADDFEAGVEWLRYFADHRYTKIRPELEALMGNPVPEMGAVTTVNAASVTELVPGSLAAVFGSSLARTGGIANESPLPLTLGGTQVSVNGIAAPLLFASPKQINFQVPWNLGEGPATLAISVEGIEGNTLDVEIAPAAPGVLAPLHADFSWVSGGNPVKDDEILVLYVTGLGAVVNPVRDGEAAPLDRLSPTVDPVTATVNGVEAKVLFAGLAPGLAGVYQVNVQMPPIEQPGDWKLVLQQHGVESPAVTLARVIP